MKIDRLKNILENNYYYGFIYHFTSLESLILMIKNGFIIKSKNYNFISFTRNPLFQNHYDMTSEKFQVRICLNYEKLKQYLKKFNFYAMKKDFHRKESEEIIMANTFDISDFIIEIHVLNTIQNINPYNVYNMNNKHIKGNVDNKEEIITIYNQQLKELNEIKYKCPYPIEFINSFKHPKYQFLKNLSTDE